ncbi:hypothetical protein [Hymenobacter sp. UYP22]|uniref:hypothetical protein n=1 Tax=Hymenobacter sp. UYP22 TaxID=3156348 RepID=UPI003397379E
MKRPLLSLLLSLALLTAACKKESEAPAPSVEGRWTIKSLVSYEYAPDGTLIRQVTDTSAAARHFYTVISKEAILHYAVKDDHPLGGSPITYLDPTTVQYNQGKIIFQDLTAHRLVLHYVPERAFVNQPYYEYDDVYAR